MSRTQLQRTLLDAATILSSAANIARRAAAAVDVDGAQYEGPSSLTPSPSFPPRTTRPWPSQTSTESKETNTKSTSTLLHKQIKQKWPSSVLETPSSGPPAHHSVFKGNSSLTKGTQEKWESSKGNRELDKGDNPNITSTISKEAKAERSAPDVLVSTKASPTHATIKSATEPHEDGAKEIPSHVEAARLDTDSASEAVREHAIDTNEYDATKENLSSPLRSAKVPSSRIARLLHYGSLGAGLAWGAAGSYFSREGQESKQFMSDDNIKRLVDKLSTMRGAALKLGQFMSIQDSNLLPQQIEQVMLRVQNSAHYMPQWQMEKVMRQDLGSEWRKAFDSFDDIPFASASIGQVHAATLSSSHTSEMAGKKVAVKVQFPGVRESIGSDLSNLRWLVTASALLPRGLFLDNTIRVMRRELDDECDYEREKNMCTRFGQLLNGKSEFAVPRVVDDLCSPRVLTCEMMAGRPLTQASRYPQETRDRIARSILQLSLKELFSFRLMQTDPNWTNFLYNERTGKIELIDFGATREYGKEFMDDWLCMLRAAISGDRQACVFWSEKVGYLTGEESNEMRAAHVDSMIALGQPFRAQAPDPFPFAGQTITAQVRAQIPLMLRERLTPPPEPTYSLNRKLSGAFLLCARLQANVSCRSLFEDITRDYVLGKETHKDTISRPSTSTSSQRGFHTMRIAADRQVNSHRKRQRLGNLADQWPRHVLNAVEANKDTLDANGNRDEYVTLASEPQATSMARPTMENEKTVDLRTKAAGGEKSRPSDAAESPLTAPTSTSDSTALHGGFIVIRGIQVPRRPNPPGPEDCCMSGCARCVYDLYAEDLQDYQQDLSTVRSQLLALNPPLDPQAWDEELLGPRPSEQSIDAPLDVRTAEKRAQDEVDAVIGKLDPTMKAFLELERSLKKKAKNAQQ